MDAMMMVFSRSSPSKMILGFSMYIFSEYVPFLMKIVLGVSEESGKLLIAPWIDLNWQEPSLATVMRV
jgi:hypothetical protein